MTDKQIQQKLNQLTKIANELGAEAERRWGGDGNLFFEAEGGFYMMTGDSDTSVAERQIHVRFSSEGYCTMGCGAW